VEEAQAMIREVKGYAILSGYRGKPPLDVDALARLLSQVSQVMTSHDEIEELDLNPVFLFSKGLIVVDARIRISEWKEGSVVEH
jgi:acyl-CoA synthetase (NDP forming)